MAGGTFTYGEPPEPPQPLLMPAAANMGALQPQTRVRLAPYTPPMRIQYGCCEYCRENGLKNPNLNPDGSLRPRANLAYSSNVDGGEVEVAAPPEQEISQGSASSGDDDEYFDYRDEFPIPRHDAGETSSDEVDYRSEPYPDEDTPHEFRSATLDIELSLIHI